MEKKSYADYKILGIHSFVDTLEKSGAEFSLFDEDYSSDFTDIINSGDTITTGFLSKEGHTAYFAEFGIKITQSYNSYIVFIFDHHPVKDEIQGIVDELESIISANLDEVDISEISAALERQKEGKDVLPN